MDWYCVCVAEGSKDSGFLVFKIWMHVPMNIAYLLYYDLAVQVLNHILYHQKPIV